MDTTKQYIKMCEKAVEIQEQTNAIFQVGDFVVNPFDHTKSNVTTICGFFEGSAIWLPRQDQLQEMSGLNWITFDSECRFLAATSSLNTKHFYIENIAEAISKEKAGLLVVMKEKFNKTWTGEEWEDGNTN